MIFTVELTNPSYASTFFLMVFTYDADRGPDHNNLDGGTTSGSLLEASGVSTFKVTTEPGILSASVTNLGDDTVGEYTDISVSFTVRNPVAADGYFLFSMAKWNAGTQTVGLETS